MRKIKNKYSRRFLAVIWVMVAAVVFFFIWAVKALTEVVIGLAYGDLSQVIYESRVKAVVLSSSLNSISHDLWEGE